LLFTFLSAALIASTAAAQEVSANADGTVSIRASETPLLRILRAVAEVHPFTRLVIDPDVEDRPVTVTIEHANVTRALTRILISADVNYVFSGSDRLFIGEGRAAGENPQSVRGSSVVREPELIADDPIINTVVVVTPIDSADRIVSESRKFELERALTPPGLPVRNPNVPIELPFPGPDGRPVTVLQPQGTVIPTLPFPFAPAEPINVLTSPSPSAAIGSSRPGVPVTAPQPKPQSQVIVAPVDPRLRQLMEVLAPPADPSR
jgi:hypothetical protein